MLASNRRRMRSADSWIGVSGFLISCARRRATSPQAASRCACSSAVMSSNTITKPRTASSPGSGVQAHIRVRAVRSRCRGRAARATPRARRRSAPRAPRRTARGARCRPRAPAATTRWLPTGPRRGWRRRPALAMRTVSSRSTASTPVDRRARMIASRSRSRSTACWLRVASSRARRRRLVMSLKECTRKPISSREGSGRRVAKSPLPTARVPSMRSCTGRTRRCAE